MAELISVKAALNRKRRWNSWGSEGTKPQERNKSVEEDVEEETSALNYEWQAAANFQTKSGLQEAAGVGEGGRDTSAWHQPCLCPLRLSTHTVANRLTAERRSVLGSWKWDFSQYSAAICRPAADQWSWVNPPSTSNTAQLSHSWRKLTVMGGLHSKHYSTKSDQIQALKWDVICNIFS